MTPTELTQSIVATRKELSENMQRIPDNIYRRLPKETQESWDALALHNVWLTALPRKLISVITLRVSRMEEGGEL